MKILTVNNERDDGLFKIWIEIEGYTLVALIDLEQTRALCQKIIETH